MSEIHILPVEISNKIAAGEVVERPASVIKELVENSIDAGATRITVEIKNGGATYMCVTDNGKGMSPDDALRAFYRHATSKIQTEDDLDAIYTLGFRGEALSSIGAVSKSELYTRAKNSQGGICVTCEGGEIIASEEEGMPQGTKFIVRNLFYNTPARMKFLKKDSTEAGYITDVMTHFILSHPEISFKFIKNGKEALFSQGDGRLASAIYAVYGRDYANALLPVDYEQGAVKVKGAAGKGNLARPNRSFQSFFINGRYIKSPLMTRAVEEAYKNQIMIGKYPVCVLNLEINPSFIDINVHPTKLEVKFSNDKEIYEAVYYAVKNALYAIPDVPQIEKKESKNSFSVKNLYSGKEQVEIGGSTNSGAGSDEKSALDRFLKKDGAHAANVQAQTVGGQNRADANTAESSKMQSVSGAQAENEKTQISESGKTAFDTSEGTVSTGEKSADESEKKLSESGRAAFEDVKSTLKKEAAADKSDIGVRSAENPIGAFIKTDIETSTILSEPKRELVIGGQSGAAEGQSGSFAKVEKQSQPGEKAEKNVDAQLEKQSQKDGDDGQSTSAAQSKKLLQTADEKASTALQSGVVDGQSAFDAHAQALSQQNENGAKQSLEAENFDASPNKPITKKELYRDLKIVGQLFDTYIIAECGSDVIFVDQHAAHERIKYEQLLKSIEQHELYPQMLLEGIIVKLSGAEEAAFEANEEFLSELGFVAESYGENTVIIRATPPDVEAGDAEDLFLELVGELINSKKEIIGAKMQRLTYTIACKSAVKANHSLTEKEMYGLINGVMDMENINTCPHGRPIMIKMTKKELEKEFKRIV